MSLGERLKPALFPLMAALTLGLAPFAPQPHVLEKLRWLVAGRPLALIDVFDLFLHGAPWVWLAWTLVLAVRSAPGSGEASS